MQQDLCYCSSGKTFAECCKDFLDQNRLPETPLELMRSRYSAYVLANAKYILDTTYPANRHFHSKKAILKWAKQNTWSKLQVIKSEGNYVTFRAYYLDNEKKKQVHFEHSYFQYLAGKWYYVSGDFDE
ncbi:YchJ family protein [Myroides sp. LJL119]